MIVLWCALLFHARLGKMIGEYGMAIGAVIGILVVMLAWFGINELGVGLHSYGFTEGVLSGLLIYAGIEVAFLAMIMLLIRRRASHVDDIANEQRRGHVSNSIDQ